MRFQIVRQLSQTTSIILAAHLDWAALFVVSINCFQCNAGPTCLAIGWADCANVCLNSSTSNERVIAYVVEYDIPEPGALALFGTGVLGLGIARRIRLGRKRA